eukprot:Hpha_TRINITY_DN28048_c0_g1::TRINITY_DN28048_c0_g1_i1::g.42605::m.42605
MSDSPPAGWEECYDPNYKLPFWFNTVTEASVWERPSRRAGSDLPAASSSWIGEGGWDDKGAVVAGRAGQGGMLGKGKSGAKGISPLPTKGGKEAGGGKGAMTLRRSPPRRSLDEGDLADPLLLQRKVRVLEREVDDEREKRRRAELASDADSDLRRKLRLTEEDKARLQKEVRDLEDSLQREKSRRRMLEKELNRDSRSQTPPRRGGKVEGNDRQGKAEKGKAKGEEKGKAKEEKGKAKGGK